MEWNEVVGSSQVVIDVTQTISQVGHASTETTSTITDHSPTLYATIACEMHIGETHQSSIGRETGLHTHLQFVHVRTEASQSHLLDFAFVDEMWVCVVPFLR